MTPLLIGFTVAALISLFAPLTQAGWNPARDLGPRTVAFFAGWGEIAIPSVPGGPSADLYRETSGPDDSPLRIRNMKDSKRQNEGNRPGDSPDRPQVSLTPEQKKMVHKGARIWAKVAIRSYM